MLRNCIFNSGAPGITTSFTSLSVTYLTCSGLGRAVMILEYGIVLLPESVSGGIRSSVVARWTSGQQAERSILHQGHDA